MIVSHNGKTISPTNRVPVDIGGATIEATITGVSIQDPTTPANKQKVNADGSVNVVHTGSNVPDAQAIPVKATKVNAFIAKASSVTITAGASMTVIAQQDVSQYAFLYAQIRPGGLTTYEIYSLQSRADNTGNLGTALVHTGSGSSNAVTSPFRSGSPLSGLNVKNTMASDQTLTEIYMCGLKS